MTAAEWAVRAEGGPFNEEDARAFDAWAAEAPARRAEFVRAQAVLAYMNADFVRETMAAAPVVSPLRRRALIAGAVAAAGALAASVALVTFRAKPETLTYATDKGQIRAVTLADGSVVTLDTATRIDVEMLPHERRIALVSGRALFAVAKDKARPFTVTASAVKVRAVGTAFAVRHLASFPFEVLVQEGVVDVAPNAAANPLRVGANMKVVAADAQQGPFSVSKIEASAVVDELSWSRGMLAFEDVKLEAAAREFARYSNQRIIIADPAVAAITITGLFSAASPQEFAASAGESLGLKVKAEGDAIYLSRD